jgi:hypothetical protein
MKPFSGLMILFVICFSFFSCKKKEDKIVAAWDYVYLMAADSNKVQTWIFDTEKSITRTIQKPDTTTVDTGTYSIDTRLLNSPNLLINGIHPDVDGTYEILTLNKKFLIIQRVLLSDGSSSGAFMRSEFVKK